MGFHGQSLSFDFRYRILFSLWTRVKVDMGTEDWARSIYRRPGEGGRAIGSRWGKEGGEKIIYFASIVQLGWCTWFSRMPHTHEVPS